MVCEYDKKQTAFPIETSIIYLIGDQAFSVPTVTAHLGASERKWWDSLKPFRSDFEQMLKNVEAAFRPFIVELAEPSP